MSGWRSWTSVLFLASALGSACATGDTRPVRIDPEHVIYEGKPFGDLLVLAAAVQRCLQSDERPLPRIVLVDEPFDCYTSEGWREVFGCTGEHIIYMVAPTLLESHGILWSHELTHWFGTQAENDPCGRLALEKFSLDLPDAGS